MFLGSTPTITGLSRIEAAYEESDQRRYFVPCPICGEFQVLKFEQLRWPKGEPEKAVYVCEHCGQEIQNHQKHVDAAARRMAGGRGGRRQDGWASICRASTRRWAGSPGPTPRSSSSRRRRTPTLLQVFINTVLGETWTLLGEAPDWQRLYDRREACKIGTVPRGGLFLTAGADVQKDRIEVEVVAWGRGKESWSVDYRVFEGDTSRTAVWEKLTALLSETYPAASGIELPIVQLAVDSGLSPPPRSTSGRGGRVAGCW